MVEKMAGIALMIGLLSAGTLVGQEVEGRWSVRYAQAIRSSGSELLEVQKWGRATLELIVEGDNVSGTWHAEDFDESWALIGSCSEGRLRLEGVLPEPDGTDRDMIRSMRWEGRVNGDEIEGLMWIAIGPRGAPARPWTASREPAG